MREFSWAPDLPADWSHAPLRVLAEIYSGGTPDKSRQAFWTDGNIPWLNSGSVNHWAITEPSAWITEEAFASSSAQWIPAQSVLVALAGQGKTKGLAARLEFRSTANQSMAAIVPGRRLEYRFLQYWLAANYQNIRNLAGGDKRDGLNLMHIGSIQCPLPPLAIQQRIADYLDRETGEIDAMIAKLDQLVETLVARKKSMTESLFSSIFSEGTRPLWSLLSPVKDQGHPAEEVLSVYREYGVIKKSSRDDNHNRTPDNLSNYQLVLPGDVVINKMKAWQGSMGVSDFRGIVSPDYQVARPTQDIVPRFLHAVLRSQVMIPQYRLRSIGVRPSQWRLYWNDFSDLEIPLPPLDEQQRIADHLDEVTGKIDAMLAKTAELKARLLERRSALISDVVTGRKEVA